MEQVTHGWRFVHIGFEGDGVEIAGVRLWEVYRWGRSRGRITVAHPDHPDQRHAMDVYRTSEGAVDFAAGEFSNGVWGFFEPEAAPA
jgi:hypothetical protein